MLKKSALALLLSSTIVGCEGGSSATSTSTSESSETVSVIDGYLHDAKLYVDRNKNGVADDTELVGLTDDNGQISIDAADSDYARIVTIEAGSTRDSDSPGFVISDYEMYSESGSDVVTPFTTIAKVRGITLDELAAELGISSELVSGDYIALKEENPNDAPELHAIARTMTQFILPDIKSMEESEITTTVDQIQDTITTAIGNGKNPNKIDIKKDASGDFVAKDTLGTLSEFYADATVYGVSFNDYQADEEGIQKFTYDGDQVMITRKDGATQSGPFSVTITSTGILADGESTEDTLIYATTDYTLLSAPSKDIYLNTKTAFDYEDNSWPMPSTGEVTTAVFKNTTLYHVFDDSITATPAGYITKLEFGPTQVTITENFTLAIGTFDYTVSNNELIINDVLDGDDWHITPTSIGGDPRAQLNNNELIYTLSGKNVAGATNKLAMFTRNESLATSIYARWSASQ